MNEIVHIGGQLPNTKIPSTIGDLVEQFLAQSQIVKGSRNSYRKALRKYIDWINVKNLQLKDITKTEIVQFNETLLAEKYSIHTVNGYLVAVRNFYEYLESIKLYRNVAKGIKRNKISSDHKKESLTEQQAMHLLEYMKTQPLRDYAIVAMILGMALRAIEITRLNVGDIVFKSGKRVALVWGKGRKEADEDSVIIEEVGV